MESWSTLGRSWELLSQSKTAGDSGHGWRPVAQFEAEHVPISVYISEKTGIRIMLAKVDGPLVNGYFTIATEAMTTAYCHKDDGLPHALEHLVFMGSEDHPYRGLIDQLGKRCLAQSTNAWTDVDHTAYTLTTAGPEGFLAMLPIYLEHLLFPTLSDSAFMTEIHHVNADGLDAGVVYSEMEGKQFEAIELCRQQLCDVLYPEGSGYRAVTGGRVENLRKLSNEAVKAYHREYYRPDNLCLIITGQVEAQDVFLRLEGLQSKLLQRQGELPPLVRPWFHHHDTSWGGAIGGARVEKVFFPAEDETTGIVLIGWQGPSWNEFQMVLGIKILLSYLVESAQSPLYVALVDGARTGNGGAALCSRMNFGLQEGMPGMHYIQFEDVEVSRVEEVYQVFNTTLRRVAQEGPDMSRLRSLIQREKLRHLSAVEDDPHNTLAVMLLYAFLYGDRDGREEEAQIKDRLQNTVSRLETLPCADDSPEAASFWTNLLRSTFLEPASGRVGVVMGLPSRDLAREMAERQAMMMTPPPLLSSPLPSPLASTITTGGARDQDESLLVEQLEEAGSEALGSPSSSQLASSVNTGALALLDEEAQEAMLRLEEDRRRVQRERADRIAHAVAETSRPCPPGLLDRFNVPPMDSVPRVPVVTIRNLVTAQGEAVVEVMSTHSDGMGGDHPPPLPPCFQLKHPASSQAVALARSMAQKGLGTEGDLPFMIQWDHIETAFVEVTVWLETSSLPDNLRPYLELFLEVVFELPVRQDDGTLWTHEEVCQYLSSDTVYYSNALGTGHCNFYCGVWGQAASITLKVESDKSWLAVRWLRNLLYRSEFCAERVRVAAQKLLADCHRHRHDAMSLGSALMRSINFDGAHSNHAATSFIRQHATLTSILQRCRTSPAALLSDLEAFREALTHPANLRLHVVSDLRHQPDPVRPWLRDFLPPPQARLAALRLSTLSASLEATALAATGVQPPLLAPSPSPRHLPSTADSEAPHSHSYQGYAILESRHLRTAEALVPTGKGLIISSPSLESSCLVQCAPLDLSYSSPDYAPLLVAMECLTAPEGELVRRLRGLGLAEGYELTGSPEQGLLTLTLYKAPHLSRAFEEAHAMLQAYVSGASELDVACLQAARRGVIFEYIERVNRGPAAAVQSFLNYFRGMPPTFCSDLMAAVQDVTAEQVLDVMRRYLVPLFDVKRSSMVACCNSSSALKTKYELVRKLGRPIVESGTVDRLFAAMEDDFSDTASTTESESSACQHHHLGDALGRGGSWSSIKTLGLIEPQRFIIVCAAVASVALMFASNKKGV